QHAGAREERLAITDVSVYQLVEQRWLGRAQQVTPRESERVSSVTGITGVRFRLQQQNALLVALCVTAGVERMSERLRLKIPFEDQAIGGRIAKQQCSFDLARIDTGRRL